LTGSTAVDVSAHKSLLETLAVVDELDGGLVVGAAVGAAGAAVGA